MEVYRALDSWAPFETQMDFDNAGFLVGRGERPVSRVLVALDITEQVVEKVEQAMLVEGDGTTVPVRKKRVSRRDGQTA